MVPIADNGKCKTVFRATQTFVCGSSIGLGLASRYSFPLPAVPYWPTLITLVTDCFALT